MKNSLLYISKRIFLLLHKFGLKFKLQILPAHYYSSQPNLLELNDSIELWAKKSELPGIKIDVKQQYKNLKEICCKFKNEWKENKVYKEGVKRHMGPGFGYIEAQVLHSVVRWYKPKNIFEVGSGVSTYCLLNAMKINIEENHECQLTSIEPFPYNALKELWDEKKEFNLLDKKIQEIPLEFFSKLGKNDILFIDSSHTVKTGSDVNYLILEVLPRLNPGVIVHFHDIYFPYDYQTDVLKTFFQWSETSLLRSFLINNNKIEIIFAMSILHHECKKTIKHILPEYNPQKLYNGLDDRKPFKSTKKHFPTSIYFKIRD